MKTVVNDLERRPCRRPRSHLRLRPRRLRGLLSAIRYGAVVAAVAAVAAVAGVAGCASGADSDGAPVDRDADGGAPAEAQAPSSFRVTFETSAGPFEVEFVRDWSPVAVDRVYALAGLDYWAGSRIYRVNERYAQFGYSGRPGVDAEWIGAGIPDEPTRSSNIRGSVSFARGGPGTRSAILFINRSDNTDLDEMRWNGVYGFPPVGRVVKGLEAVDALYSGYGDTPMQWEDSIASVGNPFLDRMYPELDSIVAITIEGAGQ
jgi:peptidyl-prolyl cis-trans isomerase A (cyclophilin A)